MNSESEVSSIYTSAAGLPAIRMSIGRGIHTDSQSIIPMVTQVRRTLSAVGTDDTRIGHQLALTAVLWCSRVG